MKSLFYNGSVLLLSVCCFLLTVGNLTAQEEQPDKILMNNGKTKMGYVTNIGQYEVRYRTNRMQKKSEAKNIDAKIEAMKKKIEENFKNDMDSLDENNPDDKEKIDQLKLKKAQKIYDAENLYTKRLNSENVFSVTYASNNKEVVVYSPDTLGLLVLDTIQPEIEYTVNEMRNYIKGRIDGRKHKAPWATVGGIAAGLAGAPLGAFYGPLIPGAYVAVVASRSPRIDFNNVSDPTLMGDEAYEDGYTKSARRQKVKNVVIGSLSSLAVGIVSLQLIYN